MFTKKSFSNTAFIVFTLISMVMVAVDHHYLYLKRARYWLNITVAPIQYAVNWPVALIGWVESNVATRKALVDENMQLRYQQMMLEAELQKLLALKKENLQLKQLLKTSARGKSKVIAAEILAVDTNTFKQLVIIDKGKQQGIYEGQPVLDAKGVMGQVIDAGLLTSTVLLITDSKSGVPVRNNRTGERAILVGTDEINQLAMINLPKTSSVKEGDLLVTSGLARVYPEGYPVGYVEAVNSLPGDAFNQVTVRPAARLNRSRMVLLIWPDEAEKKLSEQIKKNSERIG
jgi:rod shape-determining protein MreC